MPQIDISSLSKQKRIDLTIEGDAVDVTNRQDVHVDSQSLASEPDFPADNTQYRESDPLAPVESSSANQDEYGNKAKSLVASLPVGPLRRLNPQDMDRKWKLLQQLSNTLPLNEYNLPIFIYRADMLDHSLIKRILDDQAESKHHGLMTPAAKPSKAAWEGRSTGIRDAMSHLTSAQVPLDYTEGYPTLPNGQPFWNQMDSEHKEAHDAFIFYLEMDGVRRMSGLAHLPLDQVREWYHTYYWDYRVKSFDLYRTAHQNRLKVQRMLRVEDDHFRLASKIMASVDSIVNSQDFADNLAKLDPEKLINVFEKLVKVQRISVGLPVGSAAGLDNRPQAPSTTNIIMQQITQGDAKPQDDTEDVMATLANDEDALEKAQDLILGMQQKGG